MYRRIHKLIIIIGALYTHNVLLMLKKYTQLEVTWHLYSFLSKNKKEVPYSDV